MKSDDRWLLLTLHVAAALLVSALVGCGNTSISDLETITNPPNPGVDTLLPKEQLGIHLQPNGASPSDVTEITPLVGVIRTLIKPDVKDFVGSLIDGAPSDARFMVILPQEDVDLAFVSRFANDPKVIAWELENEPENFLSWTAEQYVDWVKANAPAVRAAAGRSQKLVAAATRPMVEDYPNNLNYNKDMINLGLLDEVDVFNMHVYSKQYEKVPAVQQVVSTAQSHGVEVWVTEVGDNTLADQLSYFLQVTEVYHRLGIDPERWVIYAWNDDSLGYSIKSPDGTPGPLLAAMQARDGG